MSYTLQDALQGKPMPEEFIRECNSEIILICWDTMETTLSYMREKVKSVETIIEITNKIAGDDPERKAKIEELRGALDELILYIHEMEEQQLRMAKVLQERGVPLPH